MIWVSKKDEERLNQILNKEKWIFGNVTYTQGEKFNILSFLAKIVNWLQKFTRKERDNLNYYIAHSFQVYKQWVFEMDKDRGGKLNHLFQSNTFRKMPDGIIKLYVLKEEFNKKVYNSLISQNVGRPYNLRKALKSATFVPKIIYIFFNKKPKSADMCSQNVIDRWLPKIIKNFEYDYKKDMPEDLDYYFENKLKLKPIILEIKNQQIQWSKQQEF